MLQNQKATPELSRPKSLVLFAPKIIATAVVAFPLVAFFVHLPAVRGPGLAPDPLRQARHLAAAASAAPAVAAAVVVVVEAADHTRPAFCLVGRELHSLALHQPEARPVAFVVWQADLHEVVPAQRRPSAPASQT